MKISDIKIRTRLSFLAGFLLAAMLTVGATGWLALADTHQESIELTEKTKMLYGAADTAREAQVAFKIQIQEWKNLLLRGTDSNQFQKYRQAFIDQSAETQSLLGNLSASLSKAGVNLPLVGETLARHEQLSAKYLDTLARTVEQDHTINTYSASILDKAVQGMDRLPTQNIDDIVEHVTQLATRVAASGSESLEANFDKTTSILLIVMLVTCALGVLITVVLIQGITRPLSRAVAIAKTVASGDLNIQVKATSRDETGQLLNALQEMSNQLATVVGNVRLGTETIATASRQIAAGNLDLSSRTEEQASSLQETAASMEQLTSTVKQNADNAQQANQLATTASHIAAKGGEVISQVVRSMDSINVSSNKMSDIVGVIDGIAFQTNILALNAAVEAARVGEQGKGFAVVATEVRSLAQRSADAAKEIKELIETSANEVTQGAVLVDQAGATMAQIVQSVRRVSDIVNEISTASLEQTMGIEQVNVAVGQMDQVTQQNAALVEEASAASHSLQEQARALAQIVSVFKIGANTRTQSV